MVVPKDRRMSYCLQNDLIDVLSISEIHANFLKHLKGLFLDSSIIFLCHQSADVHVRSLNS